MSIPAVLIAIALMALTRASLQNVIFAITVAEVPRVTRLVRGVVLTLREQPYVEAAIASGTGFFRILWRHIVPNTLAPLLVQGTFIAASAMITEAILSFHRRRHAAQHPELGQHHGRGAQPLSGRLLHRAVPRASCCR